MPKMMGICDEIFVEFQNVSLLLVLDDLLLLSA